MKEMKKLSIAFLFLLGVTTSFSQGAIKVESKEMNKRNSDIATPHKESTEKVKEKVEIQKTDKEVREVKLEKHDDCKQSDKDKAHKQKKDFKGKGHAYGRDKEVEGKEFGKARSEEVRHKIEKKDIEEVKVEPRTSDKKPSVAKEKMEEKRKDQRQ